MVIATCCKECQPKLHCFGYRHDPHKDVCRGTVLPTDEV